MFIMLICHALASVYCYHVIQFWSAVLPLDVAKTVIQTAPDKSSTRNPFQVLNSVRGSYSFCSIILEYPTFLPLVVCLMMHKRDEEAK